tara:strand:+ start:8299 stop:9183 length:885 start_codon:yes stop_codon:yes gene_type:complete
MSEEKVELEVETEEIEVVVEEPESSDESVKVEKVEAEEPAADEELESYSKNVQSRIKKLTEKYRQEERDREEAVRLSQQLLEENKNLKTRMQNLDTGFLNERDSSLKARTEAAKRALKEAYEAGNVDGQVEAQQAMSSLAVEQQQVNSAKVQAQRQKQAAQQPAPTPAPQAQQQAPKPDEKAAKWAEKNSWFGEDRVMTGAAFALHTELTEEQGFDATSDEYYGEVDRRMREEFPHKFQTPKKTGGAQVAAAAASASRSTAKTGRRSVKLSPSQVAIAKKLGVPLEEYAKYVKD